ncbi:uncharacterized protein LOC130447923 [Diorhabda sublineata]|uniref:uncharacterized protein LOC130447923 n=1 Tax=Diorhabda sublineata TaxID=1163346 RepID=UPI0024E18666|nr:uncharacterized protein LOC130447923 [Diorhabda sublineata]
MKKQQLFSIIFLILKNVFGFDKFDLYNYPDPRFLNSHYQFKGLGLFRPHLNIKEGNENFKENNYFGGNFGGFNGEENLKNSKGESVSILNEDGNKNQHVDEKDYFEGHHFNKKEKSGDEQSAIHGHRRGHKIRGFSKSHHNDESGKTEEYYDEAHDEADNEEFVGKSGGFGESGSSRYQGGYLDKGSVTEEKKKIADIDKGTESKQISKEEEHFGENRFNGGGESFGEHKLLNNGDLGEYSGSSTFWKHHPGSNL